MDNNAKRSQAVFPLTLTLSLGEREPRLPRLDPPDALDSSIRWMGFSLSLRERAGVRGKELSSIPQSQGRLDR
jgi:hypothetical protein